LAGNKRFCPASHTKAHHSERVLTGKNTIFILQGPPQTRSKLKWAFPFCEKYDQIKKTPLNYTIFQLNIFLCLYFKEN
jgi:hypothetical protein